MEDVKITQSESIGKLAAALCKVQAKLKPAKKDMQNPFFKSEYASLESCWNACRDLLVENGLAIIQVPVAGNGNGRIEVKTILAHTSGEWISGTVSLKPKNDDCQGAGSAVSYARRYGLCSVVGIVSGEGEDDGEAAQGRSATRGTEPPPEQTREAKQKAAQKKADAEAKVIETFPGATSETDTVKSGEIRKNPDYKTKDHNLPPVRFEGMYIGKRGRAWVYQILDDGQPVGEINLPPSQVHSAGEIDGRKWVWISKWIADQKVKDGSLQHDQVDFEEYIDKRGDAWEPEESDGTDVEY